MAVETYVSYKHPHNLITIVTCSYYVSWDKHRVMHMVMVSYSLPSRDHCLISTVRVMHVLHTTCRPHPWDFPIN